MHRIVIALALLFAAACSGCSSEVNYDSTVMQESRQTEENHKRLVKATPPPSFDHSLERENLVRRLKTLNVQNKVMYISCLGMNGNVVFSGVVQGKVSSLNSLLTTPEQIAGIKTSGGYRLEKMPSPDFDGSYGKNPEGVFWFSPDGAYFEWSGPYFLSDRPVKINTPVSLMAAVDLEKKGK